MARFAAKQDADDSPWRRLGSRATASRSTHRKAAVSCDNGADAGERRSSTGVTRDHCAATTPSGRRARRRARCERAIDANARHAARIGRSSHATPVDDVKAVARRRGRAAIAAVAIRSGSPRHRQLGKIAERDRRAAAAPRAAARHSRRQHADGEPRTRRSARSPSASVRRRAVSAAVQRSRSRSTAVAGDGCTLLPSCEASGCQRSSARATRQSPGVAIRGAGVDPPARSIRQARSTRDAVMGIVNVTPDSFSDGGLFLDPERRDRARPRARRRGRRHPRRRRRVDAARAPRRCRRATSSSGSGRWSPRSPGRRRRRPTVSIDTSKAAVAEAALDARRGDRQRRHRPARRSRARRPSAPSAAARWSSCTCRARRGRCRTTRPTTTSSTTSAPSSPSGSRRRSPPGVDERRIWVDPGIGFGKTVEHNLELLRRLGELRELGRPIVVGTSRKRFIGAITGREVDERLGGTIASNVLALRRRRRGLPRPRRRARSRQALDVAEAILGRALALGSRLGSPRDGGARRRAASRRSRSSCAGSRSTPTTASPTPSRRSASGS